jgi:hypothetical protein
MRRTLATRHFQELSKRLFHQLVNPSSLLPELRGRCRDRNRSRNRIRRRAAKEKKEDVERIELLMNWAATAMCGVLRFADVDIRECPVWGLSTPPSTLGVRVCAWGSSGVLR